MRRESFKREISESDKSPSSDTTEDEKPKCNDDKQPLLSAFSESTTLKAYKSRWLMLLLFSMNTMTNAMFFMGLSSISHIAAKYYNVSEVLIEWLSNMFFLFYTLTALQAAYLMSRLGMRSLLTMSSGLQAAASILHYSGYQPKSFLFVVMGNVLAAFAYSIVLQIPGKLSVVWFPKHERATATSIGAFSNILGVSLGFVMPANIVSDSHDIVVVREGIKTLFITQMAISCIIFVLTVLLFRENPPTPTSNIVPEEMTFFGCLRTLVKDKYFMIMCQAYAIYFGLFSSLMVVISPFVTLYFPNGYKSEIGWMGFTFGMTSILASFLVGLWLDYSKRFQTMAVFLTVSSMISMAVFSLVLRYFHSFYATFVLFSTHGLVGLPLFACGLEQIAEMSYPVPEGTSNAFALVLGNLYSFIFLALFSLLISHGMCLQFELSVLSLYFLSFIFSCFAKTVLKRTNAEQECQDEGTASDKKWLNISVGRTT